LDSIQTSIFQQLYEAEINFEVSCFWDDGFQVRLGDRMNGYRAEAHVATWQEVEAWLKALRGSEKPNYRKLSAIRACPRMDEIRC
jgi:hypothetical protein